MKPFQPSRKHLPLLTVLLLLHLGISAQNVGIGTTTPDERLHVAGGDILLSPTTGGLGLLNVSPHIKIRARNANNGGVNFGLEFQVDQTTAGWIRSYIPPLIGFFPSSIRISRSGENQPDLVVTQSGTVGVGTFAPDAKLHVQDGNLRINYANSNAEIELARGGTKRAFVQLAGTSGDDIRIGTYEGNQGNFIIRTNGGNRLTVDHQGNVRIGNSIADGYRLSVAGKVICTELRVALTGNWPDYVFHNDYRLTDLEDVEKHIRQHSHLPNVPSATQIEEEGLHLGEMQRLQMEKIEELFLHVISLKKELETLKAENSLLRSARN